MGGNSDLVLVGIVLAISLISLVMAAMFRRQVLAAGEGTENMKRIAQAVQEGASAYLDVSSARWASLLPWRLSCCWLCLLKT